MKQFARVAALAAAACLALGVLAGPAMGGIVAAKFSNSTLKVTTSGMTVKSNGGEAKTCTLMEGYADNSFYGEETVLRNHEVIADGLQKIGFNCTGGTTLDLQAAYFPTYNTSTGAYNFGITALNWSSWNASPWGNYAQYAGISPTFTNGSGSTQSTIVFNEVKIGQLSGGLKKFTLSGTMTATTSTGGLITLSH